MLITSQSEAKRNHMNAKEGLKKQFNTMLAKILSENGSEDKYWILGKVKFPPEFGGKVGRVFLEACKEKPPLVKESFVYEVDNKRGTKTLLWVMHPNNALAFPTLGKTISIDNSPSVQIKRNNNNIIPLLP